MTRRVKKAYEFVWRKAPGRPWTYEIRDWTDRHPRWGAVIITFVVAAFGLGQVELPRRFGWKAVPFVAFADFMAFVAGHLFWDTEGAYVQSKEVFARGP